LLDFTACAAAAVLLCAALFVAHRRLAACLLATAMVRCLDLQPPGTCVHCAIQYCLGGSVRAGSVLTAIRIVRMLCCAVLSFKATLLLSAEKVCWVRHMQRPDRLHICHTHTTRATSLQLCEHATVHSVIAGQGLLALQVLHGLVGG
jgi:hypothetical protein